MKLFISLAVVLILSAGAVQAQQFTVEPDTLEMSGPMGELYTFHSIVTNEWDYENRIRWDADLDLPGEWEISVCQGTFLCWPPWVTSEVLTIDAEAHDTLLVKVTPQDAQGTGRITIRLTALADTTIQQEYLFVFHGGELSVEDNRPPNPENNLSWREDRASGGVANLGFYLPRSTHVIAKLFDLRGREVAQIWSGSVARGEQTIQPNLNSIPTGRYIVRLEADGVGALSKTVTVVR